MTPEKLQEAVELAKKWIRYCEKDGAVSLLKSDGYAIDKALLFLHERVKELQEQKKVWEDRAHIAGERLEAAWKEIEDAPVVKARITDCEHSGWTTFESDFDCKPGPTHKAKLVRVEEIK